MALIMEGISIHILISSYIFIEDYINSSLLHSRFTEDTS